MTEETKPCSGHRCKNRVPKNSRVSLCYPCAKEQALSELADHR